MNNTYLIIMVYHTSHLHTLTTKNIVIKQIIKKPIFKPTSGPIHEPTILVKKPLLKPSGEPIIMMKGSHIHPHIDRNGWDVSGGTSYNTGNGTIDIGGNISGDWHGNTGSSVTYGPTFPVGNGSVGTHCTTGIGGTGGTSCSIDINIPF